MTGMTDEGFSAEERAAMKERAKEVRPGKRGKKADGTADLLAKIAEMEEPDKSLAERVHAIVTEAAPDLRPKTYYGMPAYANAKGKVVLFLQPAKKFDSRYATLGFNDDANLDEGSMWPTSWAITTLSAADEKLIADLVRRAVG
jgi:uncharacterized protein YdhG (YjbR/CyaY superfamily)